MRWTVWLAVAQCFATALPGQELQLQGALRAYLDKAPMLVHFRYTLAQGSFRRDTTGVLMLPGPTGFRLELWDKVYASDGEALYLHDRNTHQTIIDSLRPSEATLWVRLLRGELPAGTVVAPPARQEGGRVLWELRHSAPWWQADVVMDTSSWAVRQILLREGADISHRLQLQEPVPWRLEQPALRLTLRDLPGKRLDLR
ncbi:MAG: hypothetical protein IH971_06915 [Candidatus Marinimicrobia bacterium]|nr:hypothetical protein [Candidatus Neomarinimicrobiota bacterium]